jgi:hypothetical protein
MNFSTSCSSTTYESSSRSSVHVPSGASSLVYSTSASGMYPIASTITYPSTSAASVASYGNFSRPVTYSEPAYGASSSVSAPSSPKSTPCTTSSVKGSSSTPSSYTPGPTTSKPVYGDSNKPPVSKPTLTTTYTSTYVDVCPTGLTTIQTTYTVAYVPSITPPSHLTIIKPNNPPVGWQVTTKLCTACAGPKTVTVTVPCSDCGQGTAKSTPTPLPSGASKLTCYGKDCERVASKVYQTTVVTLIKTSVPVTAAKLSSTGSANSVVSASFKAPKISSTSSATVLPPQSASPSWLEPVLAATSTAADIPAGSGKPVTPVYGSGNITMSFPTTTGVKATPSVTAYTPPMFTGAASTVRMGGAFAVVGLVAAMVL